MHTDSLAPVSPDPILVAATDLLLDPRTALGGPVGVARTLLMSTARLPAAATSLTESSNPAFPCKSKCASRLKSPGLGVEGPLGVPMHLVSVPAPLSDP